jgi:hypothetical protein
MPGFPSRTAPGDHGRPCTIMATAARRVAASCGLLVVAAALITSASPASAVTVAAYWVSPTGSSGALNAGCQSAAYHSVQSAVNDAEAYEAAHAGTVPTVDVCPGTYDEQVTILDSLTLTRAGVGPATIELPASVGANQSLGLSATKCQAQDVAKGVQIPQSVIEICAAGSGGSNTTGTSVALSGLTVKGNWPTGVCYDSLYDILVEGGASLSLSGSTVERAGAYPLNGCQGGVAVQVGLDATGQIGHASLTRDTIKTYQKDGVSVRSAGSTADVDHVVIKGAGATASIAQNGVEFVSGGTGQVDESTVTGNNYTGPNDANAAGILVFGGCGSPLVEHASFAGDTLRENDLGIAMINENAACTATTTTPTHDTACLNLIQNSHGYPGGVPSKDANISGFGGPVIGQQDGVLDMGSHDLICDNAISGAGYAPLGATSSLPSPPPPAFNRPVDIVYGPAIDPQTFGNTFDGRRYIPS